MRRSIVTMSALFCVALALGTGCAISNYALITDNDQVSNGQGSGIVNTNGKAVLRTEFFRPVAEYPDGTDQLIHMVDQKANGNRTLTTYNNFSTLAEPAAMDDLYCNPDWQGCAIFTAPDPESLDDDPWDGEVHEECFGARSLIMAKNIGFFRQYYGECGRGRIPLTDRLAFLNMGRLGSFRGREALFWTLTRGNTRLVLDNRSGVTREIPLSGRIEMTLPDAARERFVLDLTHPLLADVGHRVADFLDDHGTNETGFRITYNGIALDLETGGDLFTAERLRAMVRRRF
jgi:hypothetical protein